MVDRSQVPYTAFSFRVEFYEQGKGGEQLAEAAFAEVDGLEINMDVKTFQEGGNNTRQIHLAGPFTYAQLTLRRGMTRDMNMWRWFQKIMTVEGRATRYTAHIVMQTSEIGSSALNRDEVVLYKVYDCMPTKIRAPSLNAGDGGIAIEELAMVYSSFDMELPD
jgi:phage tail-like protein